MDAVPLVLQAIPHFSALGKEIVVRVENEEAGEVLLVRHVVVSARHPMERISDLPWRPKGSVPAAFKPSSRPGFVLLRYYGFAGPQRHAIEEPVTQNQRVE
jgi:hypothetical protein